jgi:hypothetical protein
MTEDKMSSSDEQGHPLNKGLQISGGTLIALLLGMGVGGPVGSSLGGAGSVQAIQAAEARILGKIETLAVHVSNQEARLQKLEERVDLHSSTPAHGQALLRLEEVLRRLQKMEEKTH